MSDRTEDVMYRQRIKQIAPAYDPRHIEAFMRSAHGTLDHMPAWLFKQEVRMAMECIDQGGKDMAERLAKSYGM